MGRLLFGIMVFFILLFAGCTLMLSSCGDYRDKDGKEFEKYRPFLDYTFENKYEVTSKEIRTADNFDYRNTEYAIRYKDSNGVARNLIFYTSQSTDYNFLKEMESSILEVLRYEIDTKYIKPNTQGKYSFSVYLSKYSAVEKKVNDDILMSVKYGPKLSNLNEFFKTNGKDIYKSITLNASFEDPNDKLYFDQHIDEIIESIKNSVGSDYEIELKTDMFHKKE